MNDLKHFKKMDGGAVINTNRNELRKAKAKRKRRAMERTQLAELQEKYDALLERVIALEQRG